MNLSYRLVWSNVRNAWVAVSELAKSHAKSGAVLVAGVVFTGVTQAAGPIVAEDGKEELVAEDIYTATGTEETISANQGGTITFAEGGGFTLNAENAAAIKSGGTTNGGGTVNEAGSGGGTYTINAGTGEFTTVVAYNNSTIDLSNAALVEITTGQKQAVGSYGPNSEVLISNLVITQNHAASDGTAILAHEGGSIVIDNLTLNTNQTGVRVTDADSQISIGSATGGTSNITVTGDNHAAVVVEENATLTLLNTTIRTEGNNSNGVEITNSSAYAETLTIETVGENSHAMVYSFGPNQANSTLELSTLYLDAKSASSDGLVLQSDLTATNQANVNLINPVIQAGRNALVLETGVAEVSVDGGIIKGDNAALYAKTDSDLTVNTTNTTIIGDVIAESGAILDLTMSSSDGKTSQLTGAVVNANEVMLNESIWTMTGDSSAQTINNNSSEIKFVDNADATFNTLTVNTYTGEGSASIHMNTSLGGDDVTGEYSDKIVVTDGGSMSGETIFVFNNVGGTYAATTDGILFVDAQGSATVDTSQMSIQGGYVSAGAYAYVGIQGQTSDPSSNTEDLYLTNTIPDGGEVGENGFITMTPNQELVPAPATPDQTVPNVPMLPDQTVPNVPMLPDQTVPNVPMLPDQTVPNVPMLPDQTVPNVPNPDQELMPAVPPAGVEPPVEPTLPTPTVPPVEAPPSGNISYSPDFVTYNAVADVVSLSANTLLGTYHERMGAQNTPLMQKEGSKSNSWVRLIADNRDVAYDNAAFNQSIEGTTTGIQVGHTIWQSSHENGAHTQVGVAAGYVQGSMDVFGDFITTQNGHAGTVDAKTTSLSGYYTLSNDNGTYLDAVMQYSFSDSNAQGQQSEVDLKSTGLRGSLEMGVPIRFNSVTLEPQAQVVAYKDTFDSALDSGGYEMSQGDNSGVILRIGGRLTPSDTSSNFKPWFAANVNKQNASTASGVMDNTNNVGLNSEKDSAWADMSVGMTYQTESGATVYGHLKQSAAIDGGKNTVTSGAIGLQKAW